MVNERIINQLAGRFVKSGIAFEDLKAEATLFALEAVEKYNPDFNTSIDTWQWKCIYEGLKGMVVKEWDWQNHRYGSDETVMHDILSAEQGHHAFEITESLSSEAKQVCQALFSAPSEYASLMPKIARGRLVRKFRKEGWSWPVIWRVFNEIKTALN
jgi:DNA-directed RNA polymerase specialized sigma subunit